ncbi:SDR family oxidoreductase [Candidatus Puniceispirillum sp.]|nr:SDR family oxidoreductase [Candidatus Puniceispirillum sp.]
MNLLLTGANGFVGRRLAIALESNPDINLTTIIRRSVEVRFNNVIVVQGIDANTDWSEAVKGQNIILHAAARTHIMKDDAANSMAKYHRINVEGTLNLARQAATVGVTRFVFISSIKVNGETTEIGVPFTADDIPKPIDNYGISKWEAEQGLLQLAADTGMEVVIIRPPMVYGPNAKGNFAKLGALLAKGVPLPLATVKNRRSFVAIDNLIDLIITCIDHPKAANQIFLASDGHDLSTPELLNRMATAMGRDAKLFPLPSRLISVAASLVGKKDEANRLLTSLQVDITKTRDVLNWSPVIDVEEGLQRCFGKNEQG